MMANAGTKRPHSGSEEHSKKKGKKQKQSAASSDDKVLLLAKLLEEFKHDNKFSERLTKVLGEAGVQAAHTLAEAIGTPQKLNSKLSSSTFSALNPLPTFEEYCKDYSGPLPKLPSISDPELERKVFTHIATTPGSEVMTDSYERLEYLGDSYIEVIARRLCYHLFPEYSEGDLAAVCKTLVGNRTISKFSFAYGFDNRLQLPPKFFQSGSKDFAQKFSKIYGDVFEAYVAAVVISDPKNGLQTIDRWLTALWKPIIFKEQNKVPIDFDAKPKLARKLLGKGIRIDYIDEREEPVSGGTIYTVAAYITGWGWQRQLLGRGKGQSKKEAGMVAATEALTNPSTAVIAAMKKDFDAQVAEERNKEGGPDMQKIKMLEDAYKGLEIGLL